MILFIFVLIEVLTMSVHGRCQKDLEFGGDIDQFYL